MLGAPAIAEGVLSSNGSPNTHHICRQLRVYSELWVYFSRPTWYPGNIEVGTLLQKDPQAQQKAAKASYLLARPDKGAQRARNIGSIADTAQIQLGSAGFRAYLRPFRGSHAPYRIGAHRGGQGLPTEPFTARFDSVVWVLWLKQPKSWIF